MRGRSEASKPALAANPYMRFCAAYRASSEWKSKRYDRLSVPEQGKLLGTLWRARSAGTRSVKGTHAPSRLAAKRLLTKRYGMWDTGTRLWPAQMIEEQDYNFKELNVGQVEDFKGVSFKLQVREFGGNYMLKRVDLPSIQEIDGVLEHVDTSFEIKRYLSEQHKKESKDIQYTNWTFYARDCYVVLRVDYEVQYTKREEVDFMKARLNTFVAVQEWKPSVPKYLLFTRTALQSLPDELKTILDVSKCVPKQSSQIQPIANGSNSASFHYFKRRGTPS